MKLRFIDNVQAVSGGAGNTTTKNMPAGKYSGLLLTLTGTTDTGQTLTLDDIGSIKVEKDGFGQLVNADIGFLNAYTDLKGGYASKPSGTAATSETVVARVPFFLEGYPNIQQINQDGDISIKLEFKNAMATRFGSNAVNMRVDAIEKNDVFQSYDLVIQSQNQQASGAGTTTDNLAGRNLSALFLRDSDDVVETISLYSDDITLLDNQPFLNIRSITNIQNKVESSEIEWVEAFIAETGVEESTQNSANQVQTQFSGAGIMEVYRFNVQWLSAEQQARFFQQVQSFLESKGR
jgi:hypothetical protein